MSELRALEAEVEGLEAIGSSLAARARPAAQQTAPGGKNVAE